MSAADLPVEIEHVLVTQEQIAQRISELAAEIDADYAGRNVLLVGVLKGAIMVMADLSRAMSSDSAVDWMAVRPMAWEQSLLVSCAS